MNTENKIKWLRISYWAGAIADLIIGIVVFFPGLTSYIWGLDMSIREGGLIFTGYFGTVAIA